MKIENVKTVSQNTALSILQGQYIGIDLVYSCFSMSAVLPQKYIAGGKTVIIKFFPDLEGEILSGIYGLKDKLRQLSVNMCGSMYIPISLYSGVQKTVDETEARITASVNSKFIPNIDFLRTDYINRCKAAITSEGITDPKIYNTVLSTMGKKFPTNFDVSLALEVFSFPTPTSAPKGVASDIKNAVKNGNCNRVVNAFAAMVGNVYNSMFTTAASVAESLEKSSRGPAARTKGLVNKTAAKIKAFEKDVCDDGKLSIGDLDVAITAFEKLFKDRINDITPTTARYYCAALWKSARKLGVEEQMDCSSIGMTMEVMEDVDWTFEDLIDENS